MQTKNHSTSAIQKKLNFLLRKIKIYQSKIWLSMALIITIFFFYTASVVSLNRFWQFEVFYYDFGIYDQAIRRLAQFQPPVIDHYTIGQKIIWADHFHPGITMLAPIYWLTNRSEALLLVQALAISATGLVIYFAVKNLTKRAELALAVLTSFFLFVGTQNAVITDFHEVTIMGFWLALAFLAAIKGWQKRLILFFILMLSLKETFFVSAVGFAFFLWFYKPEWRKMAVMMAVGALAYGIFIIKVFIPFLSGGIYQYLEKYDWRTIPFQLFYPWLKMKTVFLSFWSFLALPLLYLPTLPMILLNFVPRFLSSAPSRWDLGMHYNAEIAPVLAISAGLGFVFLQKYFPQNFVRVVAVIMVFNALFLHFFVLKGPLSLAFHPVFLEHTKNFQFLENLIQVVPEGASVMTQNNLAVRFTDRDVWLIRENYEQLNPEFIVLDMREGQNPNNFYNVPAPENFLKKVSTDSAYLTVYETGDQFVFKRNQEGEGLE